MTDRQAIWVFVNGGKLDEILCNLAKIELIESAENADEILTQEHLAIAYGLGRKRLIRTAQALGIDDQLKEILKNKRQLRKTCTVSGTKEIHSDNTQ